MIKNFIFFITVLILISSCKRSKKQAIAFNRDTALKRYLDFLDTLPYYDTSDLNYKALKAYQNNDSSFFIEFSKEQNRKEDFLKHLTIRDTCLKLKKLQDLGVDQAYRFEYNFAFGSMDIVATVTKKEKIVNLNLIVHQTQHVAVQCKILKVINKNLTLSDWDDFYLKLKQADIWGLKRENGISGLDGSRMTFTAFENVSNTSGPAKQFYVERWVYSTLRDPFNFILKISGFTKGFIG